MTFIIKELFEYCTNKTSNGTPCYKLKSIVEDIAETKEKLASIKKFLRL